MNSHSLRVIAYGICVLSVALLTAYGCYTSFSHPFIEDAQWGDVTIGDDCNECHQNAIYSTPIIPSAAESDMNWQFYSGSPWWQDEMDMTGGVNTVDSYEGTGTRHVQGDAPYAAPAVSPVTTPAVQTLGKSDAQDDSIPAAEQETKDSRRSMERRKDTSSESNEDDRDATRTRRK